MEESNLKDKLVDACATGDINGCIALAHLKPDDISPLRVHLSRFIGSLLLLILAPFIIGIIAIVFFADLVFGLFSIGLGLAIFILPFFAWRKWFLSTSIWRAALWLFLLFGCWILAFFLIISFVVYK